MSKGRKRAQYYIKTWLKCGKSVLILIDRTRSSCMFVVAAIFYRRCHLPCVPGTREDTTTYCPHHLTSLSQGRSHNKQPHPCRAWTCNAPHMINYYIRVLPMKLGWGRVGADMGYTHPGLTLTTIMACIGLHMPLPSLLGVTPWNQRPHLI